jgi:hypothetical protein
MYTRAQKESSSTSPTSIHKKSNNSESSHSFSVQRQPEINSSQEKERPSYSRNAADLLAANVMRSMAAREQGEEAQGHKGQEESGAASVAQVVMPKPELPIAPVASVSQAGQVVQLWPGDGMSPPGDCNWANYLGLRGSVLTAKAIVSTLGSCSPGDSCLFLATKIAAITAEIAARVALDATCFKGGDTGHRQQVQDKINMVNRCYRFFSNSGCPPKLVEAMAVVVECARGVVAAAAAAVAVAAVVALIAAIIALVEVIAAIAAAAAAAAAEITAAIAALSALLRVVQQALP